MAIWLRTLRVLRPKSSLSSDFRYPPDVRRHFATEMKEMQAKEDMRTYEKLGGDDLQEIRQYAIEELNRFLYKVGNPEGKYKVYKKKLIAICLCQGAAQHFLDGKTGIRDIDVWFFFEEDANVRIPDRRNMRCSKYKSLKNIGEKKIDFLKKGIKRDIVNMSKSKKPEDILRSYLQNANTRTSQELAKRPAVGLYPDKIFGKVVWKGRSQNVA